MIIISYPQHTQEGSLLKAQLINLLEHTRQQTLKIGSKLDRFELDFRVHGFMNTIGTLLKHIAALEAWYRVMIFENRGLTEEEEMQWKGAIPGQLILNLIHGNDFDYYAETLKGTRQLLLEALKDKDDEWLFDKVQYPLLPFGNHYTCLFHLMEDELSHQGQMKTIMKFFKK